MADRVIEQSEVFLGAPYLANPLGEGVSGRFDSDPLYRFDAFDCTTFVETVLAKAMSHDDDSFVATLTQIRYKNGQVSFENRNHFPSLDWIPNNKHFLKDITVPIAQGKVSYADTVIDKKAWYQAMSLESYACHLSKQDCVHLLDDLRKLGSGYTKQSVKTPFIPIKLLFKDLKIEEEVTWSGLNNELLAALPNGAVVNWVRPNWQVKKWIGTNMNISHQGFIVRKGDRVYLRHASEEKGVVDEDFAEYAAQFLAWSSLKGFNLQLPIEAK
ncbi:DUF1460 domain-containing protein [Marinomonas epiphytica]